MGYPRDNSWSGDMGIGNFSIGDHGIQRRGDRSNIWDPVLGVVDSTSCSPDTFRWQSKINTSLGTSSEPFSWRHLLEVIWGNTIAMMLSILVNKALGIGSRGVRWSHNGSGSLMSTPSNNCYSSGPSTYVTPAV